MFKELLARLARALDQKRVPYMVIGGQAVLLHGELRVTEDIDLTLGLDASEAPTVLDAMRLINLEPLVPDPREFAVRTSVLPMRDQKVNVRVDFIFSFTPYERQAIERAIERKLDDYPVRFATAEDLIIHKLFAGRARDLDDIRGILARRQGKVDGVYLRRWIGEFSRLEGKASLLRQLDGLIAEFT